MSLRSCCNNPKCHYLVWYLCLIRDIYAAIKRRRRKQRKERER